MIRAMRPQHRSWLLVLCLALLLSSDAGRVLERSLGTFFSSLGAALQWQFNAADGPNVVLPSDALQIPRVPALPIDGFVAAIKGVLLGAALGLMLCWFGGGFELLKVERLQCRPRAPPLAC